MKKIDLIQVLLSFIKVKTFNVGFCSKDNFFKRRELYFKRTKTMISYNSCTGQVLDINLAFL